jgi:predicted metal-dependent phosphoesterase TrpH
MEVTGVLHCHSRYSYDAKLSLAELRDLFLKNGIRFVCMTEHTDTLTPEVAQQFVADCAAHSDDAFLFIPGFEVPYRRAHILMIGMREFYGQYAKDADALREWTTRAPFVVLAHPVRNNFEVDSALLGEMHALEVWNQQYEGKRVPRVRSLALFETLRKEKPLLVATGGVDLHRTEHLGYPLVSVTVPALNENAILTVLKRGDFVVSSPQASFHGMGIVPRELVRAHRIQSHFSVAVIVLGKAVNALLARVGLKLPKSLARLVRRSL